ncbi:MAG: hypothetical protein OXL36_10025 [Bryobacterales bacterium]|nr:hypothetical protein [Bryobacterales bacterium]MDE0292619.1 hypothetical protein [Bryobacterales bacterium]
MKQHKIIGFGLSGVWLLAVGVVICFKYSDFGVMSLNEWGDFFAGISAPLALLWLVIGYFQQGEELRLNTEVLRAQQLELERQVEETAQLVKAANLQAQAAQQNLKQLQEREAREAKPEFVYAGGSSSGERIEIDILNRGGEACNIVFQYDGPHESRFSPTELLESNHKAKLVFHQASNQPLVYPILFLISCTDRLGNRHKMSFEHSEHNKLLKVKADPENV